ncbi:hypothetical protein LF1_28120 [Rubripirellula obstinata]|uniref:Cytochrome c domain-containing protein n=1 Tax=Rubripirellula obstinata TaxID=406547 RepID=A0A5B1CLQ5_9BACT|nr:hypothetical protein [Rubripirellula obstinata]KAA1260273.1 hypothetical protein LF1_28120 [Rubripirellula obstinata]
MKRFAILLGSMMVFASPMIFASPASAIAEFGKEFKKSFSDKEEDADWYKTVAKAGCNVCHIKRHPDKKKARNEYGQAVHKYLDKKDFPKDLFKSDPEKAKAMILEGFKKAGEMKSSDGKTFGEKIEAKELPATDWEYEG